MRTSVFSIVAVAAACTLACGLAQAEAVTYNIDPYHTYATFEIGHMGTSTNRGRFDKKEGTVVLDRAAKTGSVRIKLDPSGISTGSEQFNNHLKSGDFFNTEKFSTIEFSSSQVSFDGDKVSQVVGNLTMLGKTQPVTLKAVRFNCYQHPRLKTEVCGGDFEATIDRTQWGLDYGLAYGIPKEVRLTIQVEGVRQ